MVSARPDDASSRYAAFVPGTIPPRKLNGGLYTGERFAGDWGNVPIVPDSGMIANSHQFYAYYQTVSHARPGNNSPVPPPSTAVHAFPEIMGVFPVTESTRLSSPSDRSHT